MIEAPFEDFLEEQKEKYLSPDGHTGVVVSNPVIQEIWRGFKVPYYMLLMYIRTLSVLQHHSILQWIFEKLVIGMIAYFLLSIVNSLAQGYAKRLDDQSNAAKHVGRAKNSTDKTE